MATLMSYETSGGDKGRCDAKCYNAKGPDCDCCCGGMNHGKGLQQATENTNKIAQEWLDSYNELHPDRKLIIEKTLF